MSAGSRVSRLEPAHVLVVMPAMVLVTLVAMADAGRGPSIETVRARLKQQSQNIDSLHLRVRRITTLCVDPEILATWPSRTGLPKYLGTDEVLFAFKGRKRYSRLLELDYRSNALAKKSPLAAMPTGPFLDSARVWTGTILRERDAGPMSDGGGRYRYRSGSASDAHDCFPPSPYLLHVGMAVADPTASDEAHRNLQQLYCLAELVQRWPYTVSRAAEDVGGTPCIVLPGATVHFRIRSAFRPAGSIQDGFGTGVRKQDSHDPVTWVLQCALVGMGRYAGFSEATALPVYTEADALPDWSTLLAEWKRGLADDAGRDEPMIGNTKFEVYPVRTTLSRLIYCRADCVLRVLGTLGPEDLEQIEQSVAKLELSRKDWLYILARSMADLSSATEPTFHKGRLGFEQVILDTTQK